MKKVGKSRIKKRERNEDKRLEIDRNRQNWSMIKDDQF